MSVGLVHRDPPLCTRRVARIERYGAPRAAVRTLTVRIANPIPTHSHHTGCVASTSSGPSAALATSEPPTATPIAWPTWRLVVAVAAATPDRSAGITDTAVVVTGALTIPAPMPKTSNATWITGIGVVADRVSNSAAPAAVPAPAMHNDGRGPYRATNRPDSGAEAMTATASGKRISPAWTGEYPRPSWRYRVITNRNAANAASAMTATPTAARNGPRRNRRSSMSGSESRLSTAMSTGSATAASTKPAMTSGDSHPRPGPSINA